MRLPPARLPVVAATALSTALAACRPSVPPTPVPAAASGAALRPLAPALRGARLPDSLADSTWWRLVRDLSEPGGYFRSENFVSNELGLQYVVARLRQISPPGGVYVGVGPEQNFTYIAALEPRVAFIVDIRRQNLLQHLWYKAVFELSPTRDVFLARLFGRPLASGAAHGEAWPSDSLMARLERTPADTAFFRRTFDEVRTHLTRTRGLAIDSADLATLHYVDSVFFISGPGSLNYSSGSGGGGYGGRGFGRGMPSFSQIARMTDSAGANLGFLGTEAQYRTVRDLERRNLVIPVVGNFSGPKALRAVGSWLRERGASVNVFYTSNVEQYLWQQGDDAARFYANVAAMPIDTAARFIRSSTGGFGQRGSGFLMNQLTSGVLEIVKASGDGTLGGYYDVLRRSVP